MTDTGVSPVLFYDPVERVVATLHPNHTYEKVVFDPWQQTTYDVNDTVAPQRRSRPAIRAPIRTSRATSASTSRPQPASWQTWHAQRDRQRHGRGRARCGAKRPRPRGHADDRASRCPRPCVPDVAHNRVLRGHGLDGRRALRDPGRARHRGQPARGARRQSSRTRSRGRVVMRYDYDLLGNRIHQASMEAGERWMLNDVGGQADPRLGQPRLLRRMTYDELRRPTDSSSPRTAPSGSPSAPSTAKAQGDAATTIAAGSISSSTAPASSPTSPTTSRATS